MPYRIVSLASILIFLLFVLTSGASAQGRLPCMGQVLNVDAGQDGSWETDIPGVLSPGDCSQAQIKSGGSTDIAVDVYKLVLSKRSTVSASLQLFGAARDRTDIVMEGYDLGFHTYDTLGPAQITAGLTRYELPAGEHYLHLSGEVIEDSGYQLRIEVEEWETGDTTCTLAGPIPSGARTMEGEVLQTCSVADFESSEPFVLDGLGHLAGGVQFYEINASVEHHLVASMPSLNLRFVLLDEAGQVLAINTDLDLVLLPGKYHLAVVGLDHVNNQSYRFESSLDPIFSTDCPPVDDRASKRRVHWRAIGIQQLSRRPADRSWLRPIVRECLSTTGLGKSRPAHAAGSIQRVRGGASAL